MHRTDLTSTLNFIFTEKWKPFKNLPLRQAVLSLKRCIFIHVKLPVEFCINQYSDVAKFPAVLHNKYKHHNIKSMTARIFLFTTESFSLSIEL
jgi:hypothetical protein